MHRLDKVLEDRVFEQLRVKRPHMTPRQEKKVRQQIRRQIESAPYGIKKQA